jgi:hypothetical protein
MGPRCSLGLIDFRRFPSVEATMEVASTAQPM